jgi:P pilus assembly chaperone PapD
MVLFLAGFFLIASGKTVVAAEGLMLAPLRVVINSGERYSQVTVINQSQEKSVMYKLSLEPMRMDTDGGLTIPSQPTKRELLAQSMVRFSPRTAILPPNGKQIIRIMTRIPPNLPDGEYFTYLAAVPTPVEVEKTEQQQQQGGIQTQLNLLVSIKIPLIIQHGDTHAETEIMGARLSKDAKGKDNLQILLKRTGNKSSVVGIKAYSLEGGKKTLIGRTPRVVTYIPLAERVAPVYLLDGVAFKGGMILIELTDYEARDDKVISSKEFLIQ